MESYTTGSGQVLKVHDRAVCQALKRGLNTCVIHARADTHMLGWPTHWRSDWGGFMEVICPHGIGHPAPEETRPGGFGHGCDGCCSDPAKAEVNPTSATFRYRLGGLMRCCIKTLTEEFAEIEAGAVKYSDGDTLNCRWCQSRMILTDGVWVWDQRRSWYTPEAQAA